MHKRIITRILPQDEGTPLLPDSYLIPTFLITWCQQILSVEGDGRTVMVNWLTFRGNLHSFKKVLPKLEHTSESPGGLTKTECRPLH